MKTTIEKTRMVAIGGGILFVIALICLVTLYSQNKKLNKSVQLEQSQNTTLLTQKHALQNEIDHLTSAIADMNGRNVELDNLLTEIKVKLNGAQVELNRLTKDRMDINAMQKKLLEVQVLKDELEAQVMALNEKMENLTHENLALTNTIINLENENREMAVNLEVAQAILTNNFLIEAVKGNNEKPTISAKRAREIKVDFDILATNQSQIHFKIIKPNTDVIDSKTDKNFTLRGSAPTIGLLANISPASNIPIKANRISMVYRPTMKLRSGIYTVEVYNNDIYLGASQIKLR
ncbi:MAG: hypothetical protein V1733_07835 [bacterium]